MCICVCGVLFVVISVSICARERLCVCRQFVPECVECVCAASTCVCVCVCSLAFEMDNSHNLRPQLSIATGIVYFHRFYDHHSFAEFDPFLVSTAALFLAAKVEETPKKIVEVISVAFQEKYKRQIEESVSRRLQSIHPTFEAELR